MAIKIADLYKPGSNAFTVVDSNDIAGGLYTVESLSDLNNSSNTFIQDNTEWQIYKESHFKPGMLAYVKATNQYYQYQLNGSWKKFNFGDDSNVTMSFNNAAHILTINNQRYDLSSLYMDAIIENVSGIYVGCLDNGEYARYNFVNEVCTQNYLTTEFDMIELTEDNTYSVYNNKLPFIFAVTPKNEFTKVNYSYDIVFGEIVNDDGTRTPNVVTATGELTKSNLSTNECDIWYMLLDDDNTSYNVTLAFSKEGSIAYGGGLNFVGNTGSEIKNYIDNTFTMNFIKENLNIITADIYSGSLTLNGFTNNTLVLAIPTSFLVHLSAFCSDYIYGTIDWDEDSFYVSENSNDEYTIYCLLLNDLIGETQTSITLKIKFN